MFPRGTIGYWQDVVDRQLPPKDQVLARNYRLTAQYAKWYQAHPELFKWAGMASFSSRQVGIALTPYQIVVDAEEAVLVLENAIAPKRAGASTGQIIDIKNKEIPLPRKAEILPGLNMLRETNNAVF